MFAGVRCLNQADKRSAMSDWLIAIFGAIIAALVPEIALGASIGSLFFLLASETSSGKRKAAMMLVGWFVGYFIASPLISTGWAGLIAVIGSAFSVILMLQVYASIENRDGALLGVLDKIVDLLSRIRRG